MAIRHDIRTRLYLNDDWRDVSSDVRVSDGITITRGRPDEAGETPPQTCNFTLDNRTGTYSVRNPTSQWYGYLGRGNPVEVCKYLVQDAASTTVTGGWGTTETGTSGILSTYSWTVTGGSTSDYAKAAGKATHSVTSTNVRRLSYLASFGQRDVDVTATVSVNVTNITGAAIHSDVVIRGVSLDPLLQVAARLTITTAEAVQLDFVDGNGDTWASGPTTITGITHTSSQALKIRAQTEGQALRAKVWVATAGEPSTWNYTWVNVAADETLAYVEGWIGIGSTRATGNTNGTVTFSYDDIIVTSPRFVGEVANYETGGDPSARERYVRVEVAGVIRRLLQGTSPLQSAPRRFIPTDGQGVAEVQFYWPLEDGPLVLEAQPLVGDVSLQLSSGSPERVFGQGNLAAWLAPTANLQGSDGFSTIPDITMTNFVAADGWMLDFVRFDGTQQDTAIQMLYGTAGGFDVLFDVSAQTISVTDDTTTVNIPYPTAFDGGTHHIRFSASGSGTITWEMLVDGTSIGGNSYAGTLDSLFYFLISNGIAASNPMPVGHVAVYNGTFTTSAFQAWDAAFGFRGETAGRRLQRLCGENGIEFTWLGDIDATTPMGPQGVKPLMELLRECAMADQGTLYESKGSTGLVYRTRSAAYGQTALITLDASQRQVGYPFEPVEDDQLVVNNVIVQRTYGTSYEVELTSGALSSASPPDGVGRYDTEFTSNVEADSQLADIANWRLALGTVDEPRFPDLWVDLDASEAQQFEDEILDLTPDDLITVTNASSVGIYNTINVLARGYTETWTSHKHTVRFNASPYGPNNVFVLDTSRLDAEGITTNEALDTTETGVDTVIATGKALWNTADLSYDVVIGGERMTVTAVTGATSPQTLTVTRSVNGVVKSHSTGAAVSLAVPYYLGR